MGLFRRSKAEGGEPALRLYYASDIHGTEVLWKKFLNAPKYYKAQVLVMGGDITGKVPDMSRCVFNLHVPPYDSRLDTAAELDDDFNMVLIGKEPHMIPVGSTGVRRAIEEFQPVAALHGHIHESAGANRIGRTLCVNPGSDYHTGRIAGCLLQLRPGSVRHQFVTG